MNTQVNWAVEIGVVLALCGLLSLMMTGCGTTTGWKVEFGAAPVTSLHDEMGLNPNEFSTRAERKY